MKISIRNLTLGATVVLASALAACGGGGGGSTPPSVLPSTGSTATPAATATPTLTPPSTPGPTSSPGGSVAAGSATISGTVVDYTNAAPVVGATVALSPQGVALNPSTIATTASDGTFSATLSTVGPYVLVISASGRPTLHEYVTIASGANAKGTLKLVSLTAEDTSEIALINSDRASHGGAPTVTPDEFAMEVARFHASDMAGNAGLGSPYYSHTDRNGLSAQQRYANASGIGGDSETICGGVSRTYADCEATYIAEGPPPTGQANHYSIITNPAQVWVGVGSSTAQPVNGLAQSTYYDEEYVQYPF